MTSVSISTRTSFAASWRGTAGRVTPNQAVAGQPRPKHLSTDSDPLSRFHRWLANLRVLEINEPIFLSHPLANAINPRFGLG